MADTCRFSQGLAACILRFGDEEVEPRMHVPAIQSCVQERVGDCSLVPLCLGRIGWRGIALGGQNLIAV